MADEDESCRRTTCIFHAGNVTLFAKIEKHLDDSDNERDKQHEETINRIHTLDTDIVKINTGVRTRMGFMAIAVGLTLGTFGYVEGQISSAGDKLDALSAIVHAGKEKRLSTEGDVRAIVDRLDKMEAELEKHQTREGDRFFGFKVDKRR